MLMGGQMLKEDAPGIGLLVTLKPIRPTPSPLEMELRSSLSRIRCGMALRRSAQDPASGGWFELDPGQIVLPLVQRERSQIEREFLVRRWRSDVETKREFRDRLCRIAPPNQRSRGVKFAKIKSTG